MTENDLKKNVLSDDEQNLLREKFISEYSKSKGWNVKELSPTQMLEIATQKGCYTMSDVFLIKQSLEKLKLQFEVTETLPTNQTAPIKEVITT